MFMFSKRAGMWWTIPAALIWGMLFVSVSPAWSQDAEDTASDEADDNAAKQWRLRGYNKSGSFPLGVVVSPDGKKVYYGQWAPADGQRWGPMFHTLEIDSGDIQETKEALSDAARLRNSITNVSFSPDGKHMLLTLRMNKYPSSVTFLVRDLTTGKTASIHAPGWASAEWVGKKIAVTQHDSDGNFGYVRLYSTNGKKMARTKFRGRVLTANPMGTRLVLMADPTDPTRITDQRRAGIVVLNADTNEVIHRLKAEDHQLTAAAFMSRSGDYAAVGRDWGDDPRFNAFHLTLFTSEGPDTSLTIRRTSRITPVAVTDDGKTVIITCPSDARSGALKLMDTNGMSRTLVPSDVIGAAVRGKMLYYIACNNKGAPVMKVIRLNSDAPFTDDELTAEERRELDAAGDEDDQDDQEEDGLFADEDDTDGTTPKQWPLDGPDPRWSGWLNVVASPDGKEIYYDHWGWGVHVLDTESGRTDQVTEARSQVLKDFVPVQEVKFSPDGRYMLLTLYGPTFIVRNLKTGKRAKIPNAGPAWAEWAGKRIAVARLFPEGTFCHARLYPASGKKAKKTKFRGRILAADTKGTRLVMMADTQDPTKKTDPAQAGIVVVNGANGEVIHSLQPKTRIHSSLARMSPSGKYAAVGLTSSAYEGSAAMTYQFAIFAAEDPDTSLVIRRTTRRMAPIAVTDDGRAVVIIGSTNWQSGKLKLIDINGKSRLLATINATGGAVHGETAYCATNDREEGPCMKAIPIKLDGALPDDELTPAERLEHEKVPLRDQLEEDDDVGEDDHLFDDEDDADDADTPRPEGRAAGEWPLHVTFSRYSWGRPEVTVSPDGMTVYFAANALKAYGDVRALDTGNGEIRPMRDFLKKHDDTDYGVIRIAPSPDGRHLLVTMGSTDEPLFVVRDLITDKRYEISADGKAWAEWAGNKIAVSQRTPERQYDRVTMYSTTGRKVKKTRLYGRVLAADATGMRLVMMADTSDPKKPVKPGDAGLAVVNAAGGKIIHYLQPTGVVSDLAVVMSPSGKYAAVWLSSQAFRKELPHIMAIFSTEDPDKSLVIGRRAGRRIPIAVTDDGQAVAIISPHGRKGRVNILGPKGVGEQVLPGPKLKLVGINGKSHTFAEVNAFAGVVHDNTAYCFVLDEDKAAIMKAIPVDFDVPLTDDELTAEERRKKNASP
ncbi:MAG: WD40 repeat domain-containing protein [Planctomycetota bacterium]|jgi:DNA-binding beta-propeller fold protein YncE